MMPSRGLYIAKGQTPRIIRQQCRNLSSAAPRARLRVSHGSNAILHTSRPLIRAIPIAATSIPAIRNASSWRSWLRPGDQQEADAFQAAHSTPTPAPFAPEPVEAATPPAETISSSPLQAHPNEATPFPDLDTVLVQADPAASIASIPEGIGYLKQIGLDYGIGPTAGIEWVLEHIHIYTGLPWWASIAATAITLRLALLPLFIKQSDQVARQAALSPIMKPMTDRMWAAQKERDTQALMLAQQQLRHIRKRAGVNYRDQLIPVAVQGILGYCGFKLMRAAATLPVPGFKDGGFLWLSDLTMTDGYLLLPMLMGATLHLIVRYGGESGASAAAEMPKGMKEVMMYVMPVAMVAFTAFQPGAVAVWFASTGLVGVTQGQLLRVASVRKFLGIAPMYYPKAEEKNKTMIETIAARIQPASAPNPDPKPAPAPSGPAVPPAAKNVQYMRPTYQTPNLNLRKKRRTIDTTPDTPSSATPEPTIDMVKPQQSLTQSFADFGKAAVDQANKWQGKNLTPEEQKQADKEAYKRKVEAYEKEHGGKRR